MRKIKRILPAYKVTMDKSPIWQPFPTEKVNDLDPFLLLHHHKNIIEPGTHPRDMGVDPHPHRGFSPVTFVIKGSLTHRDSRNNINTISEGGIQWLEAGMGIIHSERPSKQFAYKGGELELVQLWINLPAKYKLKEPKYFSLSQEESTKLEFAKGAWLHLFSGTINQRVGKIKPVHPVTSAVGYLKEANLISLSVSNCEQTFIYLVSGSVRFPSFGLVEEKNLILFEPSNDPIEIEGKEDAVFLILGANSIEEKMLKYGPYVMQNETQVMEAMRDYQMGKMGFLVEEF